MPALLMVNEYRRRGATSTVGGLPERLLVLLKGEQERLDGKPIIQERQMKATVLVVQEEYMQAALLTPECGG